MAFKQHGGVKSVSAAAHAPVAADRGSLAVVTGHLACLPEFSWDQHGIRLTEATCSGKIPSTHISLCSAFPPPELLQ